MKRMTIDYNMLSLVNVIIEYVQKETEVYSDEEIINKTMWLTQMIINCRVVNTIFMTEKRGNILKIKSGALSFPIINS